MIEVTLLYHSFTGPLITYITFIAGEGKKNNKLMSGGSQW